jgi:hypothetical protein
MNERCKMWTLQVRNLLRENCTLYNNTKTVPERDSFIAQKACIHHEISWHQGHHKRDICCDVYSTGLIAVFYEDCNEIIFCKGRQYLHELSIIFKNDRIDHFGAVDSTSLHLRDPGILFQPGGLLSYLRVFTAFLVPTSKFQYSASNYATGSSFWSYPSHALLTIHHSTLHDLRNWKHFKRKNGTEYTRKFACFEVFATV